MATKRKVNNNGFFSQIKWGESYTSLFLGAVVVVVALVLIVSFIKSRNVSNQGATSSSTVNGEQMGTKLPKTYVVKKGDDLWHIAQNLYGSGYNWVDLASANKLENPGTVFAGSVLVVPDVKPKMLTVETQVKSVQQVNTISGTSYTIEKGDYLWSIAVRAYGDGYKWVEIAKANNLVNPSLIHSGNTLKLPR